MNVFKLAINSKVSKKYNKVTDARTNESARDELVHSMNLIAWGSCELSWDGKMKMSADIGLLL